MKKEKKEYTPVRMVLRKLELAGTILNVSTGTEGDITDYDYQEEDDV